MKGETFLLLLRLGFSLSLVFGLMWVAAKVLRNKGGRRGRVADHLEVIERKPLTKNSSIAIVRVGDETLAVGITDTHVSLLGAAEVELPSDDAAANDALSAADVADDLDLRPTRSARRAPARTSGETVVALGDTSRRGLLDALRDRTVRHIPG